MIILEQGYDERSECLSILTSMSLIEYKAISFDSFQSGGNLDGQRDVIRKSTIASKIRKRMNDDFVAGAIFPSVVIGILLNDSIYEKVKSKSVDFSDVIRQVRHNDISIIDGMQRSNIYFSNFQSCKEKKIRVEFWISNKSVKLLYRMLVLNTGQVPWNTCRQIEVIFSNLSQSIMQSVYEKYPELNNRIEIISVDDNKRRTQAGKFHKSTMIEMYMGFNTRNVKVEVSDELADEFQRFDMMESIEKDINFTIFVDVLACLFRLDLCFSNCPDTADNGQFSSGKDLFASAPVCLGFIVACAEYIMGKIPVERTPEQKSEKSTHLISQVDTIIKQTEEHHNNYLSLESLNDLIAQLPKTRIGDEMRRTFKNAFSELLRYNDLDEINSLEAFWRS